MIALHPLQSIQLKLAGTVGLEQMATLHKCLIRRTGRLIRPQGRHTLYVTANDSVQMELLHYLDILD